MIFGSLVSGPALAQAQAEQQHLIKMQAALATYPYQSSVQLNLPSNSISGVFGLQAENATAAMLPSLNGLSVAANVRLDNRRDLCQQLALETASSDAEIILHSYQRWGVDCPQQLIGDFAFAIWDENQQRLFCARDFVGTRPFYYHHNPSAQRFVFATDLLAMDAHPEVPMQLNLPYVLANLQTTLGQFSHPAQTYYENIEKLPPAHALFWDANGIKTWAYWQPGQSPERRYADEQDYVDEMLSLLNEAVACRVASPHPVGAHISGGLDSSSMAVLANRILQKEGRQAIGFSWAPPLPADPNDMLAVDERRLVEAVRAAEQNLNIRYNQLSGQDVLAHATRDITLQPTTTLQFELATSRDAASLGIRTMLSGWGGDEIMVFNGRGYFSDLLRKGRWLTLQRELSHRGELIDMPVWKQWILSGLFPLLPTALLKLLQPQDYPPAPALPSSLRPAFAEKLKRVRPLIKPDLRESPGVRKMQIALLNNGHLSYRMESWASHGATLGITYAYPLLDKRLVEFALSIPDYMFLKNGWKRYLYRTAMKGILPENVAWHKRKEDPAMAAGGRSVHQEVAEQLKASVQARADNPYVDIEQMNAAVESESNLQRALADENLTGVQRRRIRMQMGAGREKWLVFVKNPFIKEREDIG